MEASLGRTQTEVRNDTVPGVPTERSRYRATVDLWLTNWTGKRGLLRKHPGSHFQKVLSASGSGSKGGSWKKKKKTSRWDQNSEEKLPGGRGGVNTLVVTMRKTCSETKSHCWDEEPCFSDADKTVPELDQHPRPPSLSPAGALYGRRLTWPLGQSQFRGQNPSPITARQSRKRQAWS